MCRPGAQGTFPYYKVLLTILFKKNNKKTTKKPQTKKSPKHHKIGEGDIGDRYFSVIHSLVLILSFFYIKYSENSV